MTSSLGFVVLARRPGQPDEIVSAVFPAYPNGLEQAQNVVESCQSERTFRKRCWDRREAAGRNKSGKWTDPDLDPVVYVIGEIREQA